jgi:hypothetical protein
MTLSEEWAVTTKNPDIHTIPPIPWQDTSISAMLAVPAVKLSDPASAKAPALYAMLSDFKSRQLTTPGFRLFNFPDPTSSIAAATLPPPAASPSIPSFPTNEHLTGAVPSPHTALKENPPQLPDARSPPAQTPPSNTPVTQLSVTTQPAEPPHAPNGIETGIPSASSKKRSKKQSNTKAPVPPILVIDASMASEVTPMDESTKKGQKRKLEATEETQKNAKRATRYVKF